MKNTSCNPYKFDGDYIYEYQVNLSSNSTNGTGTIIQTSETQKYPLHFINVLISGIVTSSGNNYIIFDISHLPIKHRIVDVIFFTPNNNIVATTTYPLPYITSTGSLSSNSISFGPFSIPGPTATLYITYY